MTAAVFTWGRRQLTVFNLEMLYEHIAPSSVLCQWKMIRVGRGGEKTRFNNLSMNLSMLALSWLNETQEGEKTTINSRSCAFPNVECQCAEWRHNCCIVSLWGEGRTSFMSCVSVMQQRQNVSSTFVDLKCDFCVIIKPLKHKLLWDWNVIFFFL